jgi:hypothetical protein
MLLPYTVNLHSLAGRSFEPSGLIFRESVPLLWHDETVRLQGVECPGCRGFSNFQFFGGLAHRIDDAAIVCPVIAF